MSETEHSGQDQRIDELEVRVAKLESQIEELLQKSGVVQEKKPSINLHQHAAQVQRDNQLAKKLNVTSSDIKNLRSR